LKIWEDIEDRKLKIEHFFKEKGIAGAMVDQSKFTIMVIDDTEANIDILVDMLGSDYDVSVAMDGDSALQDIAENPPDLILLDIMMPGMDGYQVCERLKAGDKTRDIPVIFLTSMTEEQDRAKGFQLGAVDYIIKPFNPELVKVRVRNQLEIKRDRDRLDERRSLAGISQKWNSKEVMMGALDSSRPVIMVVDDEEEIIDILVETLKDRYDISVATDGEGALQAVVENPPDMILLDVIMPGMDGYEVCRRLKADKRTSGIPVIFVTVMDEVVDEARGFELGAVDYITKPVSPPIVQARVKNHLDLETGRKELEKVNMELRETKNRELKDSEARYRALFEGAAEGILITESRKGKFKYANPAFCLLLGYTEDELRGMTAKDIHPAEVLARIISEFKATEREGKSMTQHDIPFLKKDGTIIYADVVTTPMILMDGASCSATFLIDMTERKKAEDEKKKIEEQLWQAQKMEAIGRLSGGIAHDFNNMLTSILGNAELALMCMGADDSSRELLEDIKLAGEKAAILTRQLLAFSRKQVIQPQIFNLNEVVHEMDNMLRRLIGEDIDLETRLSPDLGMVETDPGQVEQIIMNLAVNARDAMPEGGRLTIETADVELDKKYAASHFPVIPGHYEMISVSDTGVGIPKEIQSEIFDPFFTTKEKGKGTGLGLSIVYGIVKQSNGYIWVYSEPGKGAAFKIYLPRVDKGDNSGEEAKAGAKELFMGSETIMVVEDDVMIMEMIVKVLNSCGYTVLRAGDGNEALRVSDEYKGPIHLVLTDVIMPGMGGRELANRLEETRPDTKILYMSGYADQAIVHNGVLEKGLSFIQKPFTSNSLKKKIREVMG